MPVRLLDSTLITLTLSLYDWTHYITKKSAVKMHTLLDYDCLLLEFVNITDRKVSDNKAAFETDIQPFSVVVADRGYCGYALLNRWDSNGVFFVVRHKANIRYTRIEERPLPEKRAQNVLIDEAVEQERPELLTNNFSLAASTIAALYKARWEIEIFFRNIKQLLRIKSFIGTSRNAVKTQIWTALTTMLVLCRLKRIAKYKWALANLVVSLRLNTFTKIDLFKWLDEPFTPPPDYETHS